MESDRILLQRMIFTGYHGTRPEEQTLGQRFIVDLELHADLRAAGLSDDLAQSVDYSLVHARVREIVTGAPVQLTETLAERIALALLAEHARVEAVRVRVTKPDVRLGDTVLDGSAVEILRRREAPHA